MAAATGSSTVRSAGPGRYTLEREGRRPCIGSTVVGAAGLGREPAPCQGRRSPSLVGLDQGHDLLALDRPGTRQAQLSAVPEQRGLGRQWCLAVQQQYLGGGPIGMRFARVGHPIQEVTPDRSVQLDLLGR